MTQMLPFSVTAQGTYLHFVVSGSFAVPVKATPQSVGAGGACERPDHLGTQDELQPAFLNMSVSVWSMFTPRAQQEMQAHEPSSLSSQF